MCEERCRACVRIGEEHVLGEEKSTYEEHVLGEV